MLAAPILKPPELTLAVVWHPEPLQSRVPIGMWFADVVMIVTLAKVVCDARAVADQAGGYALVVPVTE